MSKIRGFEVVQDWARKNPDQLIIIPERSTYYSAGYDFCAPNDIELLPRVPHII